MTVIVPISVPGCAGVYVLENKLDERGIAKGLLHIPFIGVTDLFHGNPSFYSPVSIILTLQLMYRVGSPVFSSTQ